MNPIRILFFSSVTALINNKHSKTFAKWESLASCSYIVSMFLMAMMVLATDITGNSEFLFGETARLKPIFITIFVLVSLGIHRYFIMGEMFENGLQRFESFKYKAVSTFIFIASLSFVSLLVLFVAIFGAFA